MRLNQSLEPCRQWWTKLRLFPKFESTPRGISLRIDPQSEGL